MKNIAIIPARSGSKRLKDKNIKLLNGKPLMAYTIDAALTSACFDEIMVSTDSEKYADIAKSLGATVPFLRSSAESSDTASSWNVVREVLDIYESNGESFDCFALLQPTSPLRSASDIVAGFEMLKELDAGAVVSVCKAEHSLSLFNTLPEDQSFIGFLGKPELHARQMEKTIYRLNGALYISKVKHFLTHRFIYDESCYATIMPAERSVDIDSELDFIVAEAIQKKYNHN